MARNASEVVLVSPVGCDGRRRRDNGAITPGGMDVYWRGKKYPSPSPSAASVNVVIERDPETSFCRLISSHTRCGNGREALKVYKQMREEGVKPQGYTFVAALKACISVADLECGKAIHAHVLESSHHTNAFVESTLLDMYASCGSLALARQAFEQMATRGVVSWNVMIMAYARSGMGDVALELYARMKHEGIVPDDRTFVAVLKACAAAALQGVADDQSQRRSCLEQGRAIHAEAAARGFELDAYVACTLVDMYAKCGSTGDAFRVFERMPHRNAASWNAMIIGCVHNGMGELSLELFACMQQEGCIPTSHTFVAALTACGSVAAAQEEGNAVGGADVAKAQCLVQGKAIHSGVVEGGLESHTFIANALVDMYAKCGSMADARQVFEEMAHRDVVSWNAIIMGYAEAEMAESALNLFSQMQHEGFVPDGHTFVAALKACGNLGSLESGRRIHAQLLRDGWECNSFVASSLIDMYGKCGSMADGQMLFDSLAATNSVAWHALIGSYSDQGDSIRVFDFYERMQQKGIKPDGITLLSVLAVCSHNGLPDRGQHYFQAMCLNYGISPSCKHCRCIIDVLARAGQLDEAMAFMKKMPFKPDRLTWMTILGACRKWNDVAIGRAAFECVVMLDQKCDAAYLLMEDIYALAHMPAESAKVELMRVVAGGLMEQEMCMHVMSQIHVVDTEKKFMQN